MDSPSLQRTRGARAGVITGRLRRGRSTSPPRARAAWLTHSLPPRRHDASRSTHSSLNIPSSTPTPSFAPPSISWVAGRCSRSTTSREIPRRACAVAQLSPLLPVRRLRAAARRGHGDPPLRRPASRRAPRRVRPLLVTRVVRYGDSGRRAARLLLRERPGLGISATAPRGHP